LTQWCLKRSFTKY